MIACDCPCHLPGMKVHTTDGEPCCVCRPDERPSFPRSEVQTLDPARVRPLSPTVRTARRHTQLG